MIRHTAGSFLFLVSFGVARILTYATAFYISNGVVIITLLVLLLIIYHFNKEAHND